jgi:hypothetical protein
LPTGPLHSLIGVIAQPKRLDIDQLRWRFPPEPSFLMAIEPFDTVRRRAALDTLLLQLKSLLK